MNAISFETKSSRRPLGIAVIAALVLLAVGAVLVLHARQNSVVGQWQATDRDAGGAIQTTTVRFLADGLMTLQVKTSQGTLLHANGGVPAEIFSALFPTIARTNVKGTYTIKDDVLTFKVADVNFFDAQDQPVSLSGETHASSQIFRFHRAGDMLTMDKLDGTPPLKLSRQAE